MSKSGKQILTALVGILTGIGGIIGIATGHGVEGWLMMINGTLWYMVSQRYEA